IQKGIEVTLENEIGHTKNIEQYINAAINKHEAVEQLLLKKGAKLECKDKDGRTTLSYAAEKGHEAVVRLLLEKGAELESKDKVGRTPISYATLGWSSALQDYQMQLMALQDYQMQLMLLEQLNKKRPMMARQVQDNIISHANAKAVGSVQGESCNSPTVSDQIKGGLTHIKGHEAVVKLLLEKGAKLESKDKDGRTPLSYAVEKGHEAIVKLLLEKGAELE
ncbi:hypothetical protein V498_07984, partial [Pseudogymnoascus sp. VKM F-4517 (FW-2822)]